MTASSDLIDYLLRRFSATNDIAFIDGPIDIGALSPRDLGRVWPALWFGREAHHDARTRLLADSLVAQAREGGVAPELDATSAVAVLKLVRRWNDVVETLGFMTSDPPTELPDSLRPLFEAGDPTATHRWRNQPHQATLLARLIDDRPPPKFEQIFMRTSSATHSSSKSWMSSRERASPRHWFWRASGFRTSTETTRPLATILLSR
jgi:hypothetical protein